MDESLRLHLVREIAEVLGYATAGACFIEPSALKAFR